MALDLGIDLGTANIIISTAGKGVVLSEPSVVAYNKKSESVVAVGNDAYEMLGRTPEYIVAIKPLRDGVISDYDLTEEMIKQFIRKVTGRNLFNPRIIMCVPSRITDVERRAVVEAAINSGARKVFLIEEPIAAMLGAGINITKPDGNMVVDIGGGTCDVAVISLGGIVKSASIKCAGNKFDAAIIRYVSTTYRVLIGDKTAEQLKMELINLYDPDESKTLEIKGRSLITGLPQKVTVSQMDLYNATIELALEIVDAIKEVSEQTPPELLGDIHTNGIILTGGGALLGGLPELIKQKTGIFAYVAEEPVDCVAKGTRRAFKMLDILLDGFENVSIYKYK